MLLIRSLFRPASSLSVCVTVQFIPIILLSDSVSGLSAAASLSTSNLAFPPFLKKLSEGIGGLDKFRSNFNLTTSNFSAIATVTNTMFSSASPFHEFLSPISHADSCASSELSLHTPRSSDSIIMTDSPSESDYPPTINAYTTAQAEIDSLLPALLARARAEAAEGDWYFSSRRNKDIGDLWDLGEIAPESVAAETETLTQTVTDATSSDCTKSTTNFKTKFKFNRSESQLRLASESDSKSIEHGPDYHHAAADGNEEEHEHERNLRRCCRKNLGIRDHKLKTLVYLAEVRERAWGAAAAAAASGVVQVEAEQIHLRAQEEVEKWRQFSKKRDGDGNAAAAGATPTPELNLNAQLQELCAVLEGDDKLPSLLRETWETYLSIEAAAAAVAGFNFDGEVACLRLSNLQTLYLREIRAVLEPVMLASGENQNSSPRPGTGDAGLRGPPTGKWDSEKAVNLLLIQIAAQTESSRRHAKNCHHALGPFEKLHPNRNLLPSLYPGPAASTTKSGTGGYRTTSDFLTQPRLGPRPSTASNSSSSHTDSTGTTYTGGPGPGSESPSMSISAISSSSTETPFPSLDYTAAPPTLDRSIAKPDQHSDSVVGPQTESATAAAPPVTAPRGSESAPMEKRASNFAAGLRARKLLEIRDAQSRARDSERNLQDKSHSDSPTPYYPEQLGVNLDESLFPNSYSSSYGWPWQEEFFVDHDAREFHLLNDGRTRSGVGADELLEDQLARARRAVVVRQWHNKPQHKLPNSESASHGAKKNSGKTLLSL